jgi:TolA-binding protein
MRDGRVDITRLEELFAATPKQDAFHRPRLMWQLADAYAELEARAFRERVEHEVNADDARKAGNTARAEREAAAAAKAAPVVKALRRRAIFLYTQLVHEHPSFCRSDGQGCVDQALYFLAYEHEQARQPEEARKAYLEILQRWPQSRYVPNAYLALAEQLFEEAQGNRAKLAEAERGYREALRVPPPENKVAAYAHYKLAFLYWNGGAGAQALAEVTKAIEVTEQYPALPNAPNLAKTARRDLPPIYALAGDPGKAYAFMARWSGDPPGQDAGLQRMLDNLTEGYLAAGRQAAAVAVWLDWLRHGAGARTCDVVGRVDAVLPGLGAKPEEAKAKGAAAASAPLRAARAQCASNP